MYDTLDTDKVIKDSLDDYSIVTKISSIKKDIESTKAKVLDYLEFYEKLQYLYNAHVLEDKDFNNLHIYGKKINDELSFLNTKREELNNIYNDMSINLDPYIDVDEYEFVNAMIKKLEKISKSLSLDLPHSDFVIIKNYNQKDKIIYKQYKDVYKFYNIEKIKIATEIFNNYSKERKKTFKEPSLISVETIRAKERLKEFLDHSYLNKYDEYKNFLTNVLKIENEFLLSKCLDYYKKGLVPSESFNNLLNSLGYQKELIDYISIRFRPTVKEPNLKKDYLSSIKVKFKKKTIDKDSIDKIKKGLENTTIFLAVGIIIATSANISKKLYTNIKNDNSFIDVDEEDKTIKNDIRIGEEIRLKDNAYLYNNAYDTYSMTNPYDSSFKTDDRVVGGLVLELDGQLVYVDDNTKLDTVKNNGGKIVGVLAKADESIDGFYNISSIKGEIKDEFKR